MAKVNKNVEMRPDGLPVDYENWETEKLGDFPPYFEPSEGKVFYAKLVGLDYRDPEFKRMVFEALSPTECARGPVNDQETVTVQPGENFTMSEYSLISSQAGFLMDLPIVMMVKEQVQSKSNPKQSYWTFEFKISAENRKILNARRAEYNKQLKSSTETHQALPVG